MVRAVEILLLLDATKFRTYSFLPRTVSGRIAKGA